jgi:hypothetical protein
MLPHSSATAAPPPVPQSLSNVEVTQYDRQIRLWGLQAQTRLDAHSTSPAPHTLHCEHAQCSEPCAGFVLRGLRLLGSPG